MKKRDAIQLVRRRIQWNEVDLDYVSRHLKLCLEEDVGPKYLTNPRMGDLSSKYSMVKGRAKALIVARENIVCSGLYLVPHIFRVFGIQDLKFELLREDQELIEKNTAIASIEGDTSSMLLVERTLLNFIQRLSGIATYTKKIVEVTQKHDVGLLDTRKTTPGLRYLEKYATSCGGCYNHRFGLSERILVKDNHIASKKLKNTESFREFVKEVRKRSHAEFFQVEIDVAELALCLTHQDVDAILLDNFSPEAIAEIKKDLDPEIVIELSGKIDLENVENYASCNPDFISTGTTTHRSRWVDVGLDWA